jgi:hypothetical protein
VNCTSRNQGRRRHRATVTSFESIKEAREKHHDAVAAISSWVAAPETRQKGDMDMLG